MMMMRRKKKTMIEPMMAPPRHASHHHSCWTPRAETQRGGGGHSMARALCTEGDGAFDSQRHAVPWGTPCPPQGAALEGAVDRGPYPGLQGGYGSDCCCCSDYYSGLHPTHSQGPQCGWHWTRSRGPCDAMAEWVPWGHE